jgi:hypothetical protein
MPLNFIKNRLNKEELNYDNFLYQHRSRPGTVGEEWRCKEYRTMHHCPAACKTENDAVIEHLGDHNHPTSTEAAIAIKSAINDTKKKEKEKRELLFNKYLIIK